MSLSSSPWAGRLSHQSAKAFAALMSTYNCESQAVAFAAENPATTGTKNICINGSMQVCIAEDDADWSSALAADLVQGNAKGVTLGDGYMVYLAVFCNSDGRLKIDLAGSVALDAAVECKIPYFDPTEWCCIAVVLVDAGGDVVLGTTDINAEATVYQVTGPMFPHPDNMVWR